MDTDSFTLLTLLFFMQKLLIACVFIIIIIPQGNTKSFSNGLNWCQYHDLQLDYFFLRDKLQTIGLHINQKSQRNQIKIECTFRNHC